MTLLFLWNINDKTVKRKKIMIKKKNVDILKNIYPLKKESHRFVTTHG